MTDCTCGKPNYPVIDLTPAMILFQDESCSHHSTCYDYKSVMDTLRQKVYMACREFGCFHIQLRNQCHICWKPLYQSGSLQQYDGVVQNIHSLFDETFLQSLVGTNHSVSQETHTTISRATYRGRGTESGSIDSDPNHIHITQTEPKQSWEMHRCTRILKETSSLFEEPSVVMDGSHRLQSMHNYIQVFHSVAACIVSPLILNLPQNTFLSENPCTCHGKDTPLDDTVPCCCMDLLRVFLYDSVASPKDQQLHLGSSPHTDWGSLTLVWQDVMGGLQNYCYAHHVWNDVQVPSMEELQQSTFLFCHVGDFLSLAMNHVSRDAMDKDPRIIWPSPRHQVLCPIQSTATNSLSDENKATRCSLVYFLYPPMGVSLEEAEQRLGGDLMNNASEASNQDILNSKESQQHITSEKVVQNFPYDRYILLFNQSSSSDYKSEVNPPMGKPLSQRDLAQVTYQRIRHRPFHQVIQEKWSQVQRG